MNLKRLLPLTLLFLATAPIPGLADEISPAPTERITQREDLLELDVHDADVNELIPRILEQTGLQYTFIRSQEDRLLSLKTKAKATLVLETVAFAAGFNIHKNGSYWVIHPLPLQNQSNQESPQ